MKFSLTITFLFISFFSFAQDLEPKIVESIFNQSEVREVINKVYEGEPDVIFNHEDQLYRFVQNENSNSEIEVALKKITLKKGIYKVKLKVHDLSIASALEKDLNEPKVISMLIKGSGIVHYSKNL
ncbi:hypothetical protein [Ekhidna sp.]|uniref:hypothetical protein n=1 Tax=Ekhidna sp. TaxID=2608089 RepID=UPI003CCB83D3